MKKFAILLTAVSLLSTNGAYAQGATGSAASAGSYTASSFAWGPALSGLLVLGLVVGITAGAATNSQSSFSH